ncbi:MAG: tetratricopeptide repeat protein [Myxococcota bacterium]
MVKVECPSCSAPYDLDERRLPASGLRMRCPKCGASFHVNRDGSVKDAKASARPPAKKAPKKTAIGIAPPPPPPPASVRTPRPKESKRPGAAGSATARLLAEMDAQTAAEELPQAPAPEVDLPAVAAKPNVDLPAAKKKKPLAPAFAPPPPPPVARPAPPKPKPAAKKPIAPAFDGLDLPMPAGAKKKPKKKSPLDDLDLPSPKGAKPASPLDDLDLPSPKGAKPAKPANPLDDLDLPSPKAPAAPAVAASPLDDLDLPTPKGAPGFDLDVPAPKAPSAGLDDLDLPAPASGGLDLPAPAQSFDLDLPAAAAPKGGVADLDDLLPSPSQGSTPFDDMMSDLPAPMADLPTPKGSADLPAPKDDGFDLDLPMAATGADLDLDLPQVGGGDPFDLDLPMPSDAADLLAPAADLPAVSGAVDLPATSGLDLPTPSGGMDLPTPSLGADLPTPSANSDLPAPMDMDLLLPTGDSGDFTATGVDDDLSLPSPRARGQAPDGRAGAGGAGFGELDLGGDVPSESLEFDDIPEEQHADEADLDAVGGMDLPPETADGGAVRPGRVSEAPKKPKRTALWVTLGLLTAVVLGGVGLRWTSFGIFGMHYLERFRSEAGDDATIDGILQEAEQLAATDTYQGIRAGLRKLSEARREYFLNRKLLARSAMHEALFQVRFGENPRSQNRERTILERLALRGNDAPGIHLALAASRLRAGDSSVGLELAEAKSEGPNDPYVNLVAGELALRNGQPDEALAEFQAGQAGGARWLWGIARAHRIAGHRDEFAQAVATTLEASPSHAGALVAQGGLAFALGDIERAQEAAEQAAGRTPVGDALVRASSVERAEAFGLLGRVYEHRGQRGRARQSYEAAVEASPFDIESLLGLGRVLLEERRYRDALTRFNGAEQAIGNEVAPQGALPYDVQVGIGKTRAEIALEQVQQAHTTMTVLAEVHPELPVVVLWLGKTLEAMGEQTQAIAQYERSIALAPDRFDAYLAAAQLYFAGDQPEEAGEILRRARVAVAPTSEVRRLLGQSELRRNRLPEAIAEFRAALQLDSENADALYGLASAQRRSRQLDAASTTLERLAVLDSAYPGLALERGRVFEAQGRPERAVRMFQRALSTNPDDMSLLLRLGAAQVAAKQLDEAETTLQRVLEAENANAEAQHFMGRVAFGRENYEAAQQYLDRAVALDPAVGDYHLWLGWTYLRQNNLARAMESVSKAIDIDENLGAGYYVRGQIALRGGAVRDASRDFERALQLQPSLTIAYAGLGEAYDQLGDRGDAIAAYLRAVQREPTNGAWHYRLGKLQMQAGRRGDALASLTRATTLGEEPEDKPTWLADAHRVRGDAHRVGGERGAALTAYRRYLELAPQGAIDRREVERLVDRMR